MNKIREAILANPFDIFTYFFKPVSPTKIEVIDKQIPMKIRHYQDAICRIYFKYK